jgi:hypothetical protein
MKSGLLAACWGVAGLETSGCPELAFKIDGKFTLWAARMPMSL